jgi:hypothetical protein
MYPFEDHDEWTTYPNTPGGGTVCDWTGAAGQIPATLTVSEGKTYGRRTYYWTVTFVWCGRKWVCRSRHDDMQVAWQDSIIALRLLLDALNPDLLKEQDHE